MLVELLPQHYDYTAQVPTPPVRLGWFKGKKYPDLSVGYRVCRGLCSKNPISNLCIPHFGFYVIFSLQSPNYRNKATPFHPNTLMHQFSRLHKSVACFSKTNSSYIPNAIAYLTIQHRHSSVLRTHKSRPHHPPIYKGSNPSVL